MSFKDEFNAKAKEVHALAKEKGWYENPRTPLEIHMLIVGEIAEASEEVRKGSEYVYYGPEPKFKPEGELIELADAVLRIMDYCASKSWNLGLAIEVKHRFNSGRDYRHGGKKL